MKQIKYTWLVNKKPNQIKNQKGNEIEEKKILMKMYLVSASSGDYSSWEIFGKLPHSSSHLKNQTKKKKKISKQKLKQRRREKKNNELVNYFNSPTFPDMKARSGFSTIGERVPS